MHTHKYKYTKKFQTAYCLKVVKFYTFDEITGSD